MFLVEAFWLFLPILAANQAPGVARALGLPLATMSVSPRWLGKNKTVAPYYFGPLLAILAAYFCGFKDFWIVGLTFGLGAILGDHVKSFFKRRLGMAPGAPWWPFDQVDYSLGALFLAV